jgi:chromosome segregation ATPase
MEAMRQSWSDDRLDDLNGRVDAGFARVDAQFARVDTQFARVDEKLERLDAKIDSKVDGSTAELRREMRDGFDRINQRLDRLMLTLIVVALGLAGSLLAG